MEPVPAAAAAVFGDQLPDAARFAQLLSTEGVLRGLLGPREAARIWTRHLLNSAVVSELIAPRQRVVDVGSGAGLPGIVLALRRPDLRVELVEPLQRRVEFLAEAVAVLQLSTRVRIVRGRAEEPAVLAECGNARWVTARAVAPLDRLARWCLPLLAEDGRLALLKGASAPAEIQAHRGAIARAGGRDVRVVTCGAGLLDPPVTVVTMRRAPATRQPKP